MSWVKYRGTSMRTIATLAAIAACFLPGVAVAAPQSEADMQGGAASASTAQPSAPVASERDALFGLDSSPKSSTSTAARASDSNVRFGGFYDFELAYTYPGPGHWSRAVNRLQVSAEGDLGAGVKWKLGIRGDVDPVYFGSDFYLSDVKQNQRASLFWRENYIDFGAGGWDFRLGTQNIVWGEVVGLFFADVVSARDMREFLLPSFDIMRIPQLAGRAEYFFEGDTHLELIWIPIPTFDLIGKPGAEFYPVPLPEPASSQAASLFLDPQTPSRKLSNSNYGVRGNTLVQGWDLSAFYYRSLNTQPTFYFLTGQDTHTGYAYEPRYNRIWQAGGTFSKDFGSFVMRGEAVYTSSQDFALANPFVASGGVASHASIDAILSVDFSPSTDAALNFQIFDRTVLDGGEDALALKTAGVGASIRASMKVGAFEPQILWIQNFSDAGGLVRPSVAWSMAKNTRLLVGVDVFTGPKDGFFGRYGDRDRLYTELRHDF